MYDGHGRRVAAVTSEEITFFVWDGDQLVSRETVSTQVGGDNHRELYKRGLGLIQQEEQEASGTTYTSAYRSYYVLNLHGDVFA